MFGFEWLLPAVNCGSARETRGKVALKRRNKRTKGFIFDFKSRKTRIGVFCSAFLLQFDRFLTVEESAGRSDRLPEVHNRNPPLPNLDGPFERPRPHGGNLDRTFMPREDAKRSDEYLQKNKKSVSCKSSHLQLSTLHVSPAKAALKKAF